MDNNIELLLFILFIAFSIISSFLDKKKKQKRKEQSKNMPQRTERTTVSQQQKKQEEKSPEELLREMFGLPSQAEDQTSRKDDGTTILNSNDSSWDPEGEFGNELPKEKIQVDYSPVAREIERSKYRNYSGTENVNDASKASDEIYKMTEALFKVNNESKRYSKIDLKKKLKQPESVRDYIVINDFFKSIIEYR